MQAHDLSGFTKGWFVGNFDPTLLSTDQFEVAVKRYNAGDNENRHFHKVARELTVLISGRVKMNGQEFLPDSIIEIAPGESSDFHALEPSITVVIKIPCVKGDKYEVAEEKNA